MKKFARTQFYIAGVFLVLSLTLFLIIYLFAARTIKERQVNMLELELETTEMEVNLFFNEFQYILDDIQIYIEQNGVENLYDYLLSKNKHHENSSSIYVGTKENVMYNSSGFIPPVGFDLRTRLWYQMALDKNELILTPAFLNASEDYMIATMAMPIYINDEFMGVAGVDVNINDIESHLKTRKIGKTGYAVLIDSNQKVVSVPDGWQIDSTVMDASLLNINFNETEENKVHEHIKLYKDQGSMIHTDVILDYYRLVILIPEAEFYQTLRQFGNFFVVIFILIDIIGITFILFNRTFIIKPLQRLDKDIASIDISKDIHYRIPYQSNDHFLDVKKTVNQTLDAAEEYFNEKAEANNSVYLGFQRFKLLIDSTQDFIIQIDKKHHIVSAYGKGLQKIKLEEKDLIGHTMNEVFSKEKVLHDNVLDEALQGLNKIYDWEILVDQQALVYETSVSPIYNQQEEIIGVVSISRDITEAAKKQKEIHYINQHDYLTGLYNRRTFQEKFNEVHEKKNYPMTLLMLDLNGLKLINDAFGHLKGDEALIGVSNVLKEQFKDHFVARIGGDEFAGITTGLEISDIEKMKEIIINQVSELVIENVHLSISIGYEIVDDCMHDFNDIMKKAENNMYRQKITESMSVRNNAIKAIHKTLTEKYREERIHSEKVSQLCYVIGLALNLNGDSLKELKLAGMYHDIGKIAIPDAILNKPGKLTDEEYETMKTHTELGYNMLKAADEYSKLAEYALSHHERWDGLGYPRGLKGEDIPYFARIINLADSYDAITSKRAYKEKKSKDDAVKEIIQGSSKQFDPQLAKVFVEKVLKRKWVEKG